MMDVLSHTLRPLLWAVANGNRSLWKKNKAVLTRELDDLASPAEKISERLLIMSIVQKN